jgi:ATP-dependent RNA helicase SrmB
MLAAMNERHTGFSQFLLPEPLLRGLDKAGYVDPTPVQAQVIPLARDGLDLLVCAATGTGKTAAFLLPVMQRFLDVPDPWGAVRALVLVPTRELAHQVKDHFMRLGSFTRLTATVIVGGERRDRQIAALRRNPDIVIATPGRLLDYIRSGEADLGRIEVLVLDEADRMLDLGFADDVLAIVDATNPRRQSLLFSATLHHRGLKSITDRFLEDPRVLTLDAIREQHPDIAHQRILSDGPEQKAQQLLWLLRNEPYEKALVFASTREQAGQVGNFLIGQGVRSGVLHGELDQKERNRILGLFHAGIFGVLVASDVAARGLDIPGVQLVVNYEPPRKGDDYLHRTGRTGRAGEKGLAISLVDARDWNRMESIERYLGLSVETRAIPEMKTLFQGPVKRKTPKKPGERRAKSETGAETPRVKDRERDRKNIGKRRKPSGDGAKEAGLAPLRRKSGPQGAR